MTESLKKQLSFDGYTDCDMWVLMPTINDAGTSVKLWDYKRYCQMSNYDTDIMTDNEWTVCTSFPKKVDSNGNIVNK